MRCVVRKEEMVRCYARRIKNIHLMKEEQHNERDYQKY